MEDHLPLCLLKLRQTCLSAARRRAETSSSLLVLGYLPFVVALLGRTEPIMARMAAGIALVCGAGGFIGSHLVRRLKADGFWVRGVDLQFPQFADTAADDFVIGDLRDPAFCRQIVDRRFDEVYQLAADMGGAGYIFTGQHDADIMHNSATINLNMLDACRRRNIASVFYSSSACIYPAYNQEDPENPICSES